MDQTDHARSSEKGRDAGATQWPRSDVIIDPGHGGSAPAGRSTPFGARGGTGLLEKDVTLCLARRVAHHLGGRAHLTRDGDHNLSLGGRCLVAHRADARVFLSLHANAGAPVALGVEAYVHARANHGSRALAVTLQQQLTPYGSASPVYAEELAVLTPERLPRNTAACLLEVDGLSTPEGERRLGDPRALDELGRLIANGIARYLGHAGGGSGLARTLDDGDSGPAQDLDDASIRAKALALLDQIPDRPIYSNVDHALFQKWTGTSHETMQADWDAGGIMTACNGFAGTFSNKLGLGFLGTFTLASTAAGAFVKPGGGRFPKPGDIVKMSGLHMCVTYSCSGEGGAWHVVEAGQGGKSVGADILKHTRKTFRGDSVEGWVDIERWSDGAVRARAPMAAKVAGTWEVKIGEWRVWHYTFPVSSNSVSYADADDPSASGTGTWDRDGDGKNIVITWDTGTTEIWPMAGVNAGSGSGTSNQSAVGFKRLDRNPTSLRNQLVGDKRFKVASADGDQWNYTFEGTDRVKWVDHADPTQAGRGTWIARGRTVTITWESGSTETWPVPSPMAAFTSTHSSGATYRVTPRW